MLMKRIMQCKHCLIELSNGVTLQQQSAGNADVDCFAYLLIWESRHVMGCGSWEAADGSCCRRLPVSSEATMAQFDHDSV